MANYTPNLPGFKRSPGRPQLDIIKAFRQKLKEKEVFEVSHYRALFKGFIDFNQLSEKSDSKKRSRTFTFEITFWAFLTQMMQGNKSCSMAVKAVQSWFVQKGLSRQPSSNTSAYCRARIRISHDRLMSVFEKSLKLIQRSTPQKSWCGRVVKIVDGTTWRMSDTEENQKHYPQPGNQKEGCGFPQIQLQAVICLATGLILDWVETPTRVFDGKAWKGVWKNFKERDVILTDRAYGSYFALAILGDRKIDVVSRLHQLRKKHKTPFKSLGKGDRIEQWKRPFNRPRYFTLKEWKAIPKVIHIRIVEYVVEVPGYRTKKVMLSTTLLDHKKYTKEHLAELYSKRWGIEVRFRDIKSTMDIRELKGRSPEMVRKEIIMVVIMYNLIRALIMRASNDNVDPCKISFAGALAQIRLWSSCYWQSENNIRRSSMNTYFNNSLTSFKLIDRPGRSEPRAKKRRNKVYKFLNKPRPEMIVEDKRVYQKKLA